MRKEIQLRLTPEVAADMEMVKAAAIKASGASSDAHVELVKRSIDARQRQVMVQLTVQVQEGELPVVVELEPKNFPSVHNKPEVYIIGCGPAGLFAALTLIEKGLRPIIIERGKDVRSRRRDLAAIHKEHHVHPDSNYCFGEGGAGTYSDGKLYTRSDKRGNVRKVLETFVAFGADTDILIDAHPHIGTNKLPGIISSIRAYIEAHGGQILFQSKLTHIQIESGKVKGIEINGNAFHACDKVILATGHSARDIYFMLQASGIALAFKPFAMGIRIEHPQALINEMQYKSNHLHPVLPPAAYHFAQQVEGRGVYSFCMCPGGIIAPCATASEEVVTNGWSPSKRNNPFANSGFVVGVEEKDIAYLSIHGALSGLVYQMELERKAWLAGGGTQVAPAQRMVDFVEGKLSADLPGCSYQPGLKSERMQDILPDFITKGLQETFKRIRQQKQLYYTNEAVVVGVESRTSSPVRIPRDKSTLQHPAVEGLWPCGEGGGFAGGIVSAAMDGIRVADSLVE